MQVQAIIVNPGRREKRARVRFLVDAGMPYSVVPAPLLRQLRIEPHSTRVFVLTDGTEVRRAVGDAIFVVLGKRAASPVIFGEKGDSPRLGTVSLGALGFMLDPLKRILRPLPLVLG